MVDSLFWDYYGLQQDRHYRDSVQVRVTREPEGCPLKDFVGRTSPEGVQKVKPIRSASCGRPFPLAMPLPRGSFQVARLVFFRTLWSFTLPLYLHKTPSQWSTHTARILCVIHPRSRTRSLPPFPTLIYLVPKDNTEKRFVPYLLRMVVSRAGSPAATSPQTSSF